MAKTPPKKNPPKNPPDDDQDDDQDESGDDEADRDLDNRINSVITNRLKRWGDTFAKRMEETLAKSLAGVKPAESQTEGDDQEGDQTPAGKKAKLDPKLSKMERELAETRKQLQEEKEAKAKADEQAKRAQERSILEQSLTEAGITGTLRGGALALLLGEGRIVRDDEGNVKFKGQDKYGQEVLIDPAKGVKDWAKTDGKAYVPAIDAGGSGGGNANGKLPKADVSKMSDRERASEEIRRATLGLPPLQ